jgi:hypothetical protein
VPLDVVAELQIGPGPGVRSVLVFCILGIEASGIFVERTLDGEDCEPNPENYLTLSSKVFLDLQVRFTVA